MKINNFKPMFKINNRKSYLSTWILENLPENHQDMCYVEPFCGHANTLLNKNISKQEVINDAELGIVQIFRALRDEPESFIGKLKRTTYSERVFKREQDKKHENVYEDYMSHALNEFIIRCMSKGGNMLSFAIDDEQNWKTTLKQLTNIAERVKNIYIFNISAVELVKAFDNSDSLCYCNPNLDVETNPDEHIDLFNQLNKYHGKVIVSGYATTLYKRLYQDWRCIQRKTDNRSTKRECLWVNY